MSDYKQQLADALKKYGFQPAQDGPFRRVSGFTIGRCKWREPLIEFSVMYIDTANRGDGLERFEAMVDVLNVSGFEVIYTSSELWACRVRIDNVEL